MDGRIDGSKILHDAVKSASCVYRSRGALFRETVPACINAAAASGEEKSAVFAQC